MQTWMAIVISLVVVLLGLGWILYDRRRSRRLQRRFGPSYDQTVSEMGNRRRAEAELHRREVHARQLRTRAMDHAERERFVALWKQCQARFVDDPDGAVEEADALLIQIMRIRGYAADNFQERTTDIAAAYPGHAEGYRQVHEIMEQHRRSPVSTDRLRTAFLHYRNLFDDLIGGNDEKLRRVS
jgi:hypothetical protein